MRHRQTSGAGSSGARPGIAVFLLTALSVILVLAVHGSAGPWIGFAVTTTGALIGGGTLWQQRGTLEQRIAESAKRRRADLAQSAEMQLRHRAEADRLRAELEHEQQYSTLVQEQLTRTRKQLDEERVARRAAERELDALTATLQVQGYGFGHMSRASQAVAETEAEAAAGVGGENAARAGADSGRPFRPFAGQTGSVSEAALAMAPVIEPAPAVDSVLDLTAYDETVEFSVRDVRGGVG